MMDNLLLFFENYGELIHTCVYLIVGLILIFKTGDKKLLKEVYEQMKYRTEHYRSDIDNNQTGQTFSEEKETYRLNKVTGELELTGDKVNIKDLIQSALPTLVESAIKRFLPDVEPSETEIEINSLSDDLDFLRETFNVAEDLREKYNLPADYSVKQIFDFVSQKKNDLSIELNGKLNSIKQMQENLKKVKGDQNYENEKEIIEESK